VVGKHCSLFLVRYFKLWMSAVSVNGSSNGFSSWRWWGEYLDLRGRKWREAGEDSVMRSFITCNASPNIIMVIKCRRMRCERLAVCTGEMINAYKIVVGKSEAKRPLRSPRRRWEDNIRVYFREIERRVWTGCIRLRVGTSGDFF